MHANKSAQLFLTSNGSYVGGLLLQHKGGWLTHNAYLHPSIHSAAKEATVSSSNPMVDRAAHTCIAHRLWVGWRPHIAVRTVQLLPPLHYSCTVLLPPHVYQTQPTASQPRRFPRRNHVGECLHTASNLCGSKPPLLYRRTRHVPLEAHPLYRHSSINQPGTEQPSNIHVNCYPAMRLVQPTPEMRKHVAAECRGRLPQTHRQLCTVEPHKLCVAAVVCDRPLHCWRVRCAVCWHLPTLHAGRGTFSCRPTCQCVFACIGIRMCPAESLSASEVLGKANKRPTWLCS